MTNDFFRKTFNEKELKEYGFSLGCALSSGAIIALIGDLGAGKTTLTKSIAEGLNIEEAVTSPTFTLINEYGGGRLPLYHFDVYRIDDIDELYMLGFEEYFYGNGVTVVEWADKIEKLLPEGTIIIDLAYDESPNYRLMTVRKKGSKILDFKKNK